MEQKEIMGDVFDRFIENNDWKDKLNPMEKKKLRLLHEKAEDRWETCSMLEKERNRLRNQLQPNYRKELQVLKDERDGLLKIKTKEALQIREDRKQIRKNFTVKSKHIREDRRQQLSLDPILASNLEKKNKAWEEHTKFQRDFWEYQRHIRKKYANVGEGVA